MSSQATRQTIVEAADRLFYHQGFTHTSFSDIAGAVHISRGNFYYHFKSKDQILDAVIDYRVAKTRALLTQWESETTDPAERIRTFIHILIRNRADIQRFGCPVGTLTGELAKLSHASQQAAGTLFTLFRVWLTKQFTKLGRSTDADALALHLLARSQGVATLANAFDDAAFVGREVADMQDWLGTVIANTAAPPPSGSTPAQPRLKWRPHGSGG